MPLKHTLLGLGFLHSLIIFKSYQRKQKYIYMFLLCIRVAGKKTLLFLTAKDLQIGRHH